MNIKTITTVDGVNVVDFGSAASRFYWIENLGSTTVYVSGNENIVPDGDNVKVLSAGCGTMVENLGGKVYILGAGKFQITNQGDKFPPFRNAPVADGGVMASGNPVQIDGLQEGVPFSEITVSGDDIVGQELTVNVSGKNLISGNIINKTGTVTDNSDSWIIEWTAAMYVRFDKIFLKPNTDYTISWWQKSDNGTDCVKIGVINGDDKSPIIEQSSAEIKTGAEYTLCSFTFNSGNNRNIYVQFLRASATGTVYVKKSIQLELGSTATPYEPYHGAEYTITPNSNPYVIPNDIRQQDGLNVVSVSEGELSVIGVRKNAAVKKIWDKIDELTTAIIVSNGETIE